MTLFPEFSRLLSQYLAQRDRSPAWLARRLKVHPGTVNRWLNQVTRPATPELVIRVADVLGVHAPAERRALLAAAGFAYLEGEAAAIESVTPPASAAVDTIPTRPLVQPSPVTAHQPRVNLPIAATSFVGRERELAQIAERLADPLTRLVTIVGMGGMGKSRLAVEAAARMLDQFADGVWFVGLASVTSAGLIPAAVAAALEVSLQGTIDLEEHVIHYLGDRQSLLILDNLEHLLDGAHFIERLLAGAPGVKLLVTSRARLGLEQEWLLPLDGLTVPPNGFTQLTMAEYSAGDLFVQRARRLLPDFSLVGSNTADTVRICELVEGMPLAIELAAAWLRSVPLGEIAVEIQTNRDFLATTMRNASQRHRNMRAVFDHSWQLLVDRERQVLMQVSVFRGGFTRHAATQVADADLHSLSGLVDSSWLQLTPQGRYAIHELARQYAEEKLDAEPATATRVRAVHCAYFAALAERTRGHGATPVGDSNRLSSLVVELDNLWAGWHWAAANRDFNAVGKYVAALGWLADAHGLYGEVVAEFERACTLARRMLTDSSIPQASHHQIALVLARLLNQLCFLYGRAISVERGLVCGAESIEVLRRFGVDGRSGDGSSSYLQALGNMSLVTAKLAHYEQARLYCEEMIRLTRGKHEQLGFYYFGVNSLSQVAYLQGNLAEAKHLLIECLAQTPEAFTGIAATDRLAHVYADMGDMARAAQCADAAVIAAERAGSQPTLASAFLAKADVAMAQGHLGEAENYLGRVDAIGKATGNRYVRVRFLTGKASLMRLLGRPAEAEQLYRQAYELASSMARIKDAARAQVGLGFALLDQKKVEDARMCLCAALQVAWERRIMPEVTWAVVGLAALKGYEGQLQIAGQWLQSAVAHPSCPRYVQVEAAAIGKRLTLAEPAHAFAEDDVQEPDTALERVMPELLNWSNDCPKP